MRLAAKQFVRLCFPPLASIIEELWWIQQTHLSQKENTYNNIMLAHERNQNLIYFYNEKESSGGLANYNYGLVRCIIWVRRAVPLITFTAWK